jgi:hypothetical protein
MLHSSGIPTGGTRTRKSLSGRPLPKRVRLPVSPQWVLSWFRLPAGPRPQPHPDSRSNSQGSGCAFVGPLGQPYCSPHGVSSVLMLIQPRSPVRNPFASVNRGRIWSGVLPTLLAMSAIRSFLPITTRRRASMVTGVVGGENTTGWDTTKPPLGSRLSAMR